MKTTTVKDRFGLVYGILMVLGIGTLLPWNVMITEKEFFDVRLHVEPSNARVAGNFMSIFGLTFNTFNLLAFCVTACIHASRFSLRAQIMYPLVVILLLLASTAGMALRLDLPGTVVAEYILPTLALLGICMAVLQSGVLNLACLFPPIYIQGFVVGAGLSGVGTSVLSFITQLRATEVDAGHTGEVSRTAAQVAPAAFTYFAAAASVTALCAVAFMLLGRLEFSRARLAAHQAAVRRAHGDQEDFPLGESLLGAPYDETLPEEGEPLPACERYWPAALIPYMHPATLVAERSPYWEADPADEVALTLGADGAEEPDDGGTGGPVSRTPSLTPLTQATTAPVAVPTGGRSAYAVAGSAPGAGVGSYAGSESGMSESAFRCGTALRFYRSSSASALKGMLEAALAQQQAAATGSLSQEPSGAFGSGGGYGSGVGRRISNSGSQGAPGTPRLEPSASAAQPTARATASTTSRPAAGAAAPNKGRRAGAASAPKPAARTGSDAPARGPCAFITYATSIVICMAGSLAVFPGVTAFICSATNPAVVSPCAPRAGPYGRLGGDLFVPAMFVIYALGDVTGRIASSWGPWGRRPPAAAALLFYSVARLGVVGALLLCHVVTPAPWQLPYLLRNDWWPVGLVLGLGLTQGHLLSTACMHAPAVLPPGSEARFGPVTGFCITAGCLAGSVVSTVLVEAFTSAVAGV